ncbi:uncharacterized protein V6R79_025710 [Siganus canaliculatus]
MTARSLFLTVKPPPRNNHLDTGVCVTDKNEQLARLGATLRPLTQTEETKALTSTQSVDIQISFIGVRLHFLPLPAPHYTNNRLLLLSERSQNGLDDSSTKSCGERSLHQEQPAILSITGRLY